MGMIRVSDHAEQLIREHSNGRTITATVDAILAGSVAPDGTEMWKGEQATVIGKLDYLENYIDKRFNELKSLIENTTVDRVAQGGRAPGYSTSSYNGKTYIEWPVMQDLFYDFLQEGDKEWFAGQCRAIKELSDELNCYLKDGVIYTDDFYGHPISILKATPRVIDFLKEKGCDLS